MYACEDIGSVVVLVAHTYMCVYIYARLTDRSIDCVVCRLGSLAVCLSTETDEEEEEEEEEEDEEEGEEEEEEDEEEEDNTGIITKAYIAVFDTLFNAMLFVLSSFAALMHMLTRPQSALADKLQWMDIMPISRIATMKFPSFAGTTANGGDVVAEPETAATSE